MSSITRGGPVFGLGALPTPEQRCLVRAITGPVDGIEDALRDWRALVDLSGPIDGGSYRLLPAVFHRLSEAGIDDPNRGMIKGVYRLAILENNRIVDGVTPALRALHDAGITPWLAKGAALVQAGYHPTLASRPMADIDAVVDVDRRADAIEVLRASGFAPQLSDREMEQLHGAPFVNDAGMELDLHWHQLQHARSAEADEVITRGFEEVELGGVPARVAGPTGLLIATAVHGFVPNPEPPVRWIVDAAMILEKREIVWEDVVEFATRFRLARRLERALGVIAETTPHSAPAETMAALAAIPTSPVERLERGIWSAPWNSLRGRVLQLLAGYAGGDRELKHLATGLPRYLAGRWNVDGIGQVPAAGGRKLRNWMRQ